MVAHPGSAVLRGGNSFSAMIDIKGLVKRFGDFTAVDGVTFSVSKGEVLGFLGPNGAGKSTTMKMITGFLTPTVGKAVVCGRDVGEDPIGVKERIGYLPEGAPAYPDMTPESFLHFCGRVRGLSAAERKSRISAVVDQVQLGGVMRQSIDTLSKGYKRRVGLAQALLHDPEVLIMDEPTDGLDPNQKHQVRSLIQNMAKDKCIVLSTHILEEVEAVCSRAVIIARGKLVADGTPGELRSRSRHHGAVQLTVRVKDAAEAQGVRAELSRLPQVYGVEDVGGGSGANVVSVVIVPKNQARLLPEVTQLSRGKGWEVEGIGVMTGKLDDVFRSITTGQVSEKGVGR